MLCEGFRAGPGSYTLDCIRYVCCVRDLEQAQVHIHWTALGVCLCGDLEQAQVHIHWTALGVCCVRDLEQAQVHIHWFAAGIKETVDLLNVELRKGFTSHTRYGTSPCCYLALLSIAP